MRFIRGRGRGAKNDGLRGVPLTKKIYFEFAIAIEVVMLAAVREVKSSDAEIRIGRGLDDDSANENVLFINCQINRPVGVPEVDRYYPVTTE